MGQDGYAVPTRAVRRRRSALRFASWSCSDISAGSACRAGDDFVSWRLVVRLISVRARSIVWTHSCSRACSRRRVSTILLRRSCSSAAAFAFKSASRSRSSTKLISASSPNPPASARFGAWPRGSGTASNALICLISSARRSRSSAAAASASSARRRCCSCTSSFVCSRWSTMRSLAARTFSWIWAASSTSLRLAISCSRFSATYFFIRSAATARMLSASARRCSTARCRAMMASSRLSCPSSTLRSMAASSSSCRRCRSAISHSRKAAGSTPPTSREASRLASASICRRKCCSSRFKAAALSLTGALAGAGARRATNAGGCGGGGVGAGATAAAAAAWAARARSAFSWRCWALRSCAASSSGVPYVVCGTGTCVAGAGGSGRGIGSDRGLGAVRVKGCAVVTGAAAILWPAARSKQLKIGSFNTRAGSIRLSSTNAASYSVAHVSRTHVSKFAGSKRNR
eukprot:m.101468 g.101468  ORF g.101468 m.101468 type:complete len:460 (+) comp8791_c0_seq1:378-1757(+)